MASHDAKTLAAWERGIRTLLVTSRHADAAKAAGVTEETWLRWRREPAWERLFEMRREQAASVTVDELGALFHQAKDTLLEAMGPEYDINTRVRAAEKVMAFVARTVPSAGNASPQIKALSEEVSASDAAEELRRRRLSKVIDITDDQKEDPPFEPG